MFNKVKFYIHKYEQFLKFCIVGLTNTTISLVTYYFLLQVDIHYLIASTISYCAGLLNGYFLSSSIVFNQKRNVIQALKFIGVYVSSLLLNLLFLFILVDLLELNEFISQIIVIIFNVFYNYFLNKIWTFQHLKNESKIN